MAAAHTQPSAYPLRFDSGLKEWLAQRAKENCRSLNAEIEYRLKKSREQEDPA